MSDSPRGDGERQYYAWVLAGLALLDVQQSAKLSPEERAARVMAALRSWDMQAMVAFMHVTHGSRKAQEFLKPIEEELSLRLQFCTAVLRKPKRVALRFHSAPEIYAEAATTGGRNFEVSINTGTIIALLLGAFALVDETTGCVSSMAITPERRKRPHFADCEQVWTPFLQVYEASPFNHILPREPWRIVLAHTILCRALDFFLLHEVNHIVRGHLAFDGCSKISEGPDAQIDALELVNQLMESQADDGASLHYAMKWSHLMRTHDYGIGPMSVGTSAFPFFNKADLSRMLIYALCLVFLVMEPPRNNGPSQRKYPPVEYRLWRALRLSRLHEGAGMSWSAALSEVRQSLLARGLDRAADVLTFGDGENALQRYDALLSSQGTDLFPFEKKFAAENLGPDQPPPPFPWK